MSNLFAVGDVHGCLESLETLIKHIRPQLDDTIIFLGDLIDRGNNSKGVLDYVMQLQQRCYVQCIMGNHEEMLLGAPLDPEMREAWLYHGGQETLQSFGLPPDATGLAQIPSTYIQFFQSMLPFIETERFIFSHATPLAKVPMAQQDAHGLRWNRFTAHADHRHMSGKTIVCGHTPQFSGKPWVQDGLVVIDTHAFGGAWLTALEISEKETDNLRLHQANQLEIYTTSTINLPTKHEPSEAQAEI